MVGGGEGGCLRNWAVGGWGHVRAAARPVREEAAVRGRDRLLLGLVYVVSVVWTVHKIVRQSSEKLLRQCVC